MDIQLQQILTHAFGFLIVLWLLKRYAWKPLLALMEERRTRIADEFKRIEQEQARINELAAEYQGKLKEIDAERRAKLIEAVNEGKRIAEEIRVAAREEARDITAKAKADAQREVAKAKVQLKNDMVAMTLTAVERLIKERLDESKHHELIGSFIDNVEKA
ncbi:MAG: F0F1 ATP synthase subunit B [Candidatus Zixiibacteriota bacterium]